MVYGTPEYMAPEQALGEEIDGRADLYALGVMFYEMLCGFRPFEADSRVALLGQVATKRPPTLSERVPGTYVPREVEEIVMRLLEKTSAKRYADADELIEALDIVILELDYSMMSPAAMLGARVASNPDRSGAHRPPSASFGELPAARLARSESRTVAPTGPGGSPRATQASIHEARPETTRSRVRGSRTFGIPTAALVAGVGLAAIGLSIFLAVLLRSDESIAALEGAAASATTATGGAASARAGATSNLATASPPDEDRPTPEGRAGHAELDDAKARGLTALGPLAQRYPNDPDVLKALLLAHAADRSGYMAAVGVAKRLFEISPEMTGDEDIRSVLLMAANAKPETATAAMDLMAKRMGSRGPDLLYELAVAPSVGKLPKDRAEKLLKDAEVRKIATPALLIANDLRIVTGCARKPLFPRAGSDGDARALGLLKPLLVTNGCSSGGFFGRIVGDRADCFKCLGNRAELRDAVDAIERRLEKR